MSNHIIELNRTGFCAATPEEAPFILICQSHKWAEGVASKEEATELLEDPSQWCEDCFYEEVSLNY